MAIRTTDALVIGVLTAGGDYDTEAEPSLTPYIRAASLMVDAVVTCMDDRDILSHSSALLTEIETWLSAHAYQMSDQGYAEKKTQKASGKFHGKTGEGIRGTKYGQMALMLDTSGCLAEVSSMQHAGASWGGKPRSEQISYSDRD